MGTGDCFNWLLEPFSSVVGILVIDSEDEHLITDAFLSSTHPGNMACTERAEHAFACISACQLCYNVLHSALQQWHSICAFAAAPVYTRQPKPVLLRRMMRKLLHSQKQNYCGAYLNERKFQNQSFMGDNWKGGCMRSGQHPA
jgi:hypothetical protein